MSGQKATKLETPFLGILMLDTQFHRPVGDVGNFETWPFPVRFRTVRGATARRIISADDRYLIDGFAEAGHALAEEGAACLITSCGFLALRQRELATRLPLPFASSSLLQIPMIQNLLPPGKCVGVITYDASALTGQHFAAVGADPGTPFAGLPPNGCFHSWIEGGRAYEPASLEAELLASARDLLEKHHNIGAIVLECTNLPPFAGVLQQKTGLPVYDIVTLGKWLFYGLAASGHIRQKLVQQEAEGLA